MGSTQSSSTFCWSSPAQSLHADGELVWLNDGPIRKVRCLLGGLSVQPCNLGLMNRGIGQKQLNLFIKIQLFFIGKSNWIFFLFKKFNYLFYRQKWLNLFYENSIIFYGQYIARFSFSGWHSIGSSWGKEINSFFVSGVYYIGAL